MWDCEKCKAQNEDNFDTCWSCQTFFESRVSDSTDHQLKIKEDDQKIAEEKKREAIINIGFVNLCVECIDDFTEDDQN